MTTGAAINTRIGQANAKQSAVKAAQAAAVRRELRNIKTSFPWQLNAEKNPMRMADRI
jgi:hypothetical protein